MECIKKYKNFIFATMCIFLAVCGIAITVAAVLESKKAKTLITEDFVSEIEV